MSRTKAELMDHDVMPCGVSLGAEDRNIDSLQEGSPTNLIYARSHAELAGRKERPLSEGCSIREELYTKDYGNWE